MFNANGDHCAINNSTFTGSTMTITLTNLPKQLAYSAYFGIVFGADNFAARSIIVETSTNGGASYTTRLNDNTKKTVYTCTFDSGGTATNAIRITLGTASASSQVRIQSIAAYDYNSSGMETYFLPLDGGTIYGNTQFTDNSKLSIYGCSSKLQIYHNASNSYIDDGTGQGALIFKSNTYSFRNAADNQQIAVFNEGGSINLYHNNIKQFETTSTGASIRPDSDDVGLVVGRAHIGHTVHNDWAAFAHYNKRDASGGYALLQNSSGRTILNTASGQDLQFRRNNSDLATFETNGDLTLENNLTIDNHIDMGHDSARLTSTTQTEIASFSASTFTGGKFLVTAHDHVAGSRQISELLVLRDSASGTAIATEYGQIYTDSSIATYEVDINSGNVRLLATSATANATTYQVAETLMRE